MSSQPALSLSTAWLQQARSSPWVASGLGISLLVVLALVGLSTLNALQGSGHSLRYALLGGGAGFLATALGAGLAISLRTVSARLQDALLGLAAGMMLAASSFSLILPGLAAAEQITGQPAWAAAIVILGLGLGVALMLGLDSFVPHEHDCSGPCGPNAERLGKVWLFVLAITLHNLPEGMAIGVGFAAGDLNVGIPLATAIALQDIPEGLAVAVALRAIGLPAWQALGIAALSGLLEPVGALVGIGMSTGFALAYPISMGLAAGAMIFVVSHEIIPETHRNGHQTPATLGLMGGFALMMFLDTALG